MICNILFVVLVCFFTLATAQDAAIKTCAASTGTETMCNLQLYARCPDASFWMEKPQWQSCKPCQVFWNYPRNNLTMTFVHPGPPTTTTEATILTKVRRPAKKATPPQICLSKGITGCAQVYRVLADGKFSKVAWKNGTSVCFRNSIGNNNFQFQFRASSTMRCFGVYIRYWFK